MRNRSTKRASCGQARVRREAVGADMGATWIGCVQRTRRSDRILMVGFNRGFAPAALAVKEALRSPQSADHRQLPIERRLYRRRQLDSGFAGWRPQSRRGMPYVRFLCVARELTDRIDFRAAGSRRTRPHISPTTTSSPRWATRTAQCAISCIRPRVRSWDCPRSESRSSAKVARFSSMISCTASSTPAETMLWHGTQPTKVISTN